MPYRIFLQGYCSSLKSRNRRNNTYTLKNFNQAGPVAKTRRTGRLPSRPSFDASERARPSRHIAITAILNYDQLLGTPKTSQTDCNIQFHGGSRYTSSQPSAPLVPSERDTSSYKSSYCPDKVNYILILGKSHWTDHIKTLLSTEVLIGQFELIFYSYLISSRFSLPFNKSD